MNQFAEKCAVHIIARAGYTDEIVQIARENGAGGATIINARGEGRRHESFMGITIDTEKEIILCLTDKETAKKIMLAVNEKLGIDTPARCISYSVPVDDIVGIDMSL